MQKNNTTNVLGLKDITVKKVEQNEEFIHIHADVEGIDTCPCCGSKKIWAHDYRIHKIKDTNLQGKKCIIYLRKKRYNCQTCKKRFERQLDFVAKKHTVTKRLIECIVRDLEELTSIAVISRKNNVSTNMVSRILNVIRISRKPLPEVLCIDEFKGDSGNQKYQCSLLDGVSHKVVDILPSRDLNTLTEYFKKIPKEERDKVKYFVSDMSRTFKTIKERYFKKAVHITDRYHFIRQIQWALENVRKRIQHTMPTNLRIYFKRSRSLLTKPLNKLTKEEARQVEQMLNLSEDLKLIYRMKELFYNYFLSQKDKERAEHSLKEWLRRAKDTKLKELRPSITAFTNWFEEICNSFDYDYTNGPLEGTHTKIKTLKRNCYGMRNFERFRKRIMLVCK